MNRLRDGTITLVRNKEDFLVSEILQIADNFGLCMPILKLGSWIWCSWRSYIGLIVV